MLDMASKLHRYSANNLLLIMLQRPETSAVAGYRTWQQLGRQVRRGSEAIWVLGPVKYKIETENEATGEVSQRMQLRGFKPVPVFAVEDTEGPELPAPAQLDGDAPAAIWDGLTSTLNEQGYTVERVEIPGGAKGDTYPLTKVVRIDARLHPMEALAVLCHEHHHVALGHMERIDEYRANHANARGVMETEAESATYVAMTALGFDTGDWSIEYVAGWSKGDQKLLMSTADRVVTAAHQTVDRLSPELALDPVGLELGL
jgi:antirestriction protein ArdC